MKHLRPSPGMPKQAARVNPKVEEKVVVENNMALQPTLPSDLSSAVAELKRQGEC